MAVLHSSYQDGSWRAVLDGQDETVTGCQRLLKCHQRWMLCNLYPVLREKRGAARTEQDRVCKVDLPFDSVRKKLEADVVGKNHAGRHAAERPCRSTPAPLGKGMASHSLYSRTH